MSGALVLLERNVDLRGGHEQTQIAAIDRLSGGREMVILTGWRDHAAQRLAFSDDPRLRRVFVPNRDKPSDIAAMLAADVPALAAFCEGRDCGDALLVATATTYDLRLVLGALATGRVTMAVALRLLEERQFAALPQEDQAALRAHAKSGRIRLVTETMSLSRHMEAAHDLPSEPCFVLPCTIQPGGALLPRGAAPTYRVGFLGNARREKGWHDLPPVIGALAELLRAAPLDRPVEFIVPRARKSVLKPSNVVRSAKLHLQTRRGGLIRPAVRVLRSPQYLTDAEFVGLLGSLDVVLVPYRTANYANRGSGIILDSVLAGRPLVYTEGIGMGEYLAFGNAAGATSPEGFAEAILLLLSDPGAAARGCGEARRFAEERMDEAAAFLRAL